VVCTQTVDEVTQFVNTSFANVLQILSQTELNSILNTRVLATNMHITSHNVGGNLTALSTDQLHHTYGMLWIELD